MRIEYALHDTPFGRTFIAITQRGICKLGFVDDRNYEPQIRELAHKWPRAELIESDQHTAIAIDTIFSRNHTPDRPLSLLVTGTNFQVSVWKALLRIPPGHITSYTDLANALGHPRAARAVGTAIGANPIGFVIPCHRVIRQSGELAGYHWGEIRKHAMHAWEAAAAE